MCKYFKKLSTLTVVDSTKLQEYIDFCLYNDRKIKSPFETENHHILPKSLFPEYSNLASNSWNSVHLLYEHHYTAHSLLAAAIDEPNMTFAWNSMNNKNNHKLNIISHIEIIGENMYSFLKRKANIELSKLNTNKVYCSDVDGSKIILTKEEYKNSDIEFHTTGKLVVKSNISGDYIQISTEEYHNNINLYTTAGTGNITVHDMSNNRVSITTEEYHNNINLYTRDLINKLTVIDNETGNSYQILSSEYEPNSKIYTHARAKTFRFKNRETGEYEVISTETFYNNRDRYQADMEGFRNVYNNETHKNERISIEERDANPNKYKSANTDLVTVIDLINGNTKKVSKDTFITDKTLVGPRVKFIFFKDGVFYRRYEYNRLYKEDILKCVKLDISEYIDYLLHTSK